MASIILTLLFLFGPVTNHNGTIITPGSTPPGEVDGEQGP